MKNQLVVTSFFTVGKAPNLTAHKMVVYQAKHFPIALGCNSGNPIPNERK